MLKAKFREGARNGGGCGVTCGCLLLILLINITIGAYCFDYTLKTTLGTDVHWGLDVIGGAVLGEITIPAAVICAIVKASGVETPFWNQPPQIPEEIR